MKMPTTWARSSQHSARWRVRQASSGSDCPLGRYSAALRHHRRAAAVIMVLSDGPGSGGTVLLIVPGALRPSGAAAGVEHPLHRRSGTAPLTSRAPTLDQT